MERDLDLGLLRLLGHLLPLVGKGEATSCTTLGPAPRGLGSHAVLTWWLLHAGGPTTLFFRKGILGLVNYVRKSAHYSWLSQI